MKKYFIFAAFAGVALASCTDDLVDQARPPVVEEEVLAPIAFSSSSTNFTRADFKGAEAAKKLGNKFVVFGYKGTSTGNPSTGTTVFDNYLVEYTENTANTTESNTTNWEYVGKNPIKHATDNGITQQAIKYWDYTKTQYDFIAWSTGSKTAIYEGTPTTGKVLVSEITAQAATSPAEGLGAAFTFEGEAEDLKECYIADLITVYKGNATGTAPFYNIVEKGYQKPVTLKFRQLGTKVRIGLYETIPGYSVKNVQFYNAARVDLVKVGDAIPGSDPVAYYDAEGAATANASAKIFTTVANGIYKEGTYTVTFPTVDDPSNADNNQAHIEFEAKSGAAQKTTVDWGGLNYTFRESGETSTGAIYLGRSSNTASYAGTAADNYYVIYLPNQNGTNLNLRVNYTLESIDGSGETIEVKGATAQVPSIYTAWKPGFAYTYLFKISDQTNGHTGVYDPTKPDDTSVNSDPAGLYPITFDAVVVNAEEDAKQETITTVSTPSITTYQKGSNVVNKNEYLAATGDIYVTVNDADVPTYEAVSPQPSAGASVANYYTESGGNYTPCAADDVADGGTTYYYLKDPALPNGTLATLTSKAALYTIPAGTEAEVIDALSLQDENADGAAAGTITGRSGLVLTPAKAVANAAAISDAGDYALTDKVEYGADGNTIEISTDQALRFKPAAGTYAFVYTKTASTTTTNLYQPVTKTVGVAVGDNVYRYALKAAPTTPSTDVQKGVTYFPKIDGTEGSITAFLGQNVSNLYLNATGTEQATGLAKTGTTYYYTTNGQTFSAAHPVLYAEFGTTTLYKKAECADEDKLTDSEKTAGPVNGQAYYWKDGDNKVHYCVIMPQQTTNLFVIDKDEANIVAVTKTDNAVKGMIYLDKYIQNNGVYYAKVIKVQ